MNAAREPNTAAAATKKRRQDPLNRVIQIARRQLGLDDDTYEQFLKGVTGKTSTTEMDRKELYRVVQALTKNGFKVERPGDASQFQGEQTLLVRHMWLKLKGYGVLRDSSEWALLRYVKRITKVDRFEWVKPGHMQTLVESTKKWVARIERALIFAAVESGALRLPPGFASFSAVEAYREGCCMADEVTIGGLCEFREQCDTYLASYTPPKRPTAKQKEAS